MPHLSQRLQVFGGARHEEDHLWLRKLHDSDVWLGKARRGHGAEESVKSQSKAESTLTMTVASAVITIWLGACNYMHSVTCKTPLQFP